MQEQQQRLPSAMPVLAASTICQSTSAAAVVGSWLRVLGNEYENNKKFYNSFVEFNYFNGTPDRSNKTAVSFRNPPKQVREQVGKLYSNAGYDKESVYKKLGMQRTSTNSSSPLEAAWAYRYYKKFGTWEYNPRNHVSDREIMTPLTSTEQEECSKLF